MNNNKVRKSVTYLNRQLCFLFFNLLSANVVHSRHDADVACSSCSALYRQNH